jgi:hypothetical protein
MHGLHQENKKTRRMKGSLPLPHLIAATATIYYKRHVGPAARFIDRQRALFKLVNNDLSLLGVCQYCRRYYDPTCAVQCAVDGCHRHVGCGKPKCFVFESIQVRGQRLCITCFWKDVCTECYNKCRGGRTWIEPNQSATCPVCKRANAASGK